MKRVDFCVTTFRRPRAVERLLLSIGAHYPDATIHVADQNETLEHAFYDDVAIRSGLTLAPVVHHLDHDCGISVARNHLVTQSSRELKLILDDDFVFTAATDVGVLVRLLDAHPEVGVVGGAVADDDGRVARLSTRFHQDGDTIVVTSDEDRTDSHEGVRYMLTDAVPNFALFRRDVFDHVTWDPGLKVVEHYDFYIRLKESPYGVMITPDAVIDHPRVEADPDYPRYRWRGEYLASWLAKNDATRFKACNGVITAVRPDGGLTRYCELPR